MGFINQLITRRLRRGHVFFWGNSICWDDEAMPPCLDFEVVAGFYQVGMLGSSVERS